MKRLLVLALLAAALPAIVYAQTTGRPFGDPSAPDIIPQDDSVGPVANTGAEFKFDDGFYQKIQNLIDAEPRAGDPGVFDGVRYYDVILVVSRDDGDDRDPDEVARENKEDVVKRLGLLGARDVVAAETLSFVTASIPVAEVPGFSLHEDVYKLGDGELHVESDVDLARDAIGATMRQLATSAGRSVDGTGVRVAVIDTGINHTSAFGDRIVDRVTCDDNKCGDSSKPIYGIINDKIVPSHGTVVAQILGASGLTTNNGIAPGVEILDIRHGSTASSPGAYMFWIEATDPFNHVLEPFVVEIP
ncbi:MAG: S8 family serine peptidase [Alphaproteobacteria bacterium]|nr:S8 family serine peptidase [Alphaproteobacteria bacterium]